ncbi:hypothetical protein GCM10009555_032680 [Acrocarpospora macrocephala]|uniref:Cysteinyl-tRNA synthetase n=1 Tax=Acrocarpospora macrocephala TaxID=150177 RepID=A0A5M3WDP2_9ACTN|nr:hypothetical protein [Acrocarpospora macrocephala]GES06449.1 hypothetical protein Amac_000440 [Acrocarpospora macrocephala]
MVEVHRSAARRLGGRPRAVLLDTPYAFQENAADISARARGYFARSVGLDVQVGGDVATADWVFSGPGSPTYALDRWTASGTAADLRSRVRARRGVTVLASAAACTAGVVTVPVYEIYKVGADPHWREGLDLLSALDLQVVVIPHYDNAEGGTHDTRFCYLGERRLARMEADLPDGTAVLGIDEHTAAIIDLTTDQVRVAGRGSVTIRRPGTRLQLPAGTTLTLPELRHLTSGHTTLPPPPPPPPDSAPRITLAELTQAHESRFAAALEDSDTATATQAILALESDLVAWSADTEEDSGGVAQSRDTLRHLITQLGKHAESAHHLTTLTEALVNLRATLRQDGRYDVADTLRTTLLTIGIHIDDTPTGPRWTRR